MDPNDPRRRLQALNQSNPSVRTQAAPVYNQGGKKIYIQNTSFNTTRPEDQMGPRPSAASQVGSFLKSAGEELVKPVVDTARKAGKQFSFLAGPQQSRADEILANQEATKKRVFKPETQKLFTQVESSDSAAAQKMAAGGSSEADIQKYLTEAVARKTANDKKMFSYGGQALTALVPGFAKASGVVPRAAADAAAGALYGNAATLANDEGATKGDYVKNTLIGAGTGYGLSKLGSLVEKIMKRKGGKVSEALAKETDPDAIQAATGVDTELAKYLAGENDPKVIKSVLDEAGIDNKKVLENIKKNKNAPTKSTLPEEDIAAIKEAGGQVPEKTVTSIKDLSKRATNSFENAPTGVKPGGLERATAEIDNASAKPIKYRRTPEGDIVIEDGRDRLEAARKAGINDFPAEDVTAQYTAESTPVTPPTPTETAIQEAAPVQSGVADAAPAGEAAMAAPASQAGDIGSDVAKAADTAALPEQTAKTVLPPGADPQTQKAVQEVLDSLNTAESTYKDVTKVRAAEKASRAAQAEQAYQAAGGGEEGMRAKLAALRGKYSESGFTPISTSPEAQSAILNDIANSELRSFEKTNTQNAIRKIWGAVDKKPTPSDIKYIRDYFGQEFGDAVEKAVQEAGTTWRENIGQILGLPKSIMASYDLSGTFRQGGVLASRFPKEAAAAFKEELRYFKSPEAFKQGMEEIASRPTYERMVNSKLGVEAAQGLTGTEEQFISNLAEKIPGFGKGVAASDRAYSGFLARLRADAFDSVVKGYESKGVTLTESQLQDVAKFINSASGKGDLGQYLSKHSTTLSAALFSPKLWKSRLDLLNPVYYAKLSGPARKLALQTAASFAAEATAVLSIAALAGAKVSTDLRSSDFGKIKVGNTRYDILGGLQQNLVFAWREISGEKTNSETGEVTSLKDGKFGAADRLSTLSDMIQNKENPLLAAGQRIIKGKDRGGNPVNPLTELASLAVPLPISGSIDTIRDTGSIPKGILMNAPDLVGISSQTYGGVKSKEKDASGAYKGKITPDMVTNASGDAILDKNGVPVRVKFPKNASELQKQTIIDNKRKSALAEQYKSHLSQDDQGLVSLSETKLKEYVAKGTIDQNKMDDILQIKQDIDNLDGVNIPDGAKSDYSKNFFKTYNSLTVKDKKTYLDGEPDQNAIEVTKLLNKSRSKGLSELKPSNKLAKAYAEFEKDINSHPEYTNIDIRNKTKAFQTFAYKQNYDNHVNDIYSEGGSDDLRYLIDTKAIDKKDLDAAIKMDDELFASGLTKSLKFSKKFRAATGYSSPAGGGSGGGGSSSVGNNAHLSALLPSFKNTSSPAPQFSARNRLVKGSKSPSLPQSSSKGKKISIKL